MFRAILACLLFNCADTLGGPVSLSAAWDAPPPFAAESAANAVRWLFDDDAYSRQPAIDAGYDPPASIWHAVDESLSTAALREQINTAPRSEFRDASQQPVAVPLPPAVIGGAAVALLAGSRHIFKRRRRVARTFR